MLILRRTLLLWFLMFWQGGFLFYGAIVVTIGSDVLMSDFKQGLITRRVAMAMNVTGLFVLTAWLWDWFAEPATRRKRRWGAWLFLLLTVACLMWLHPQMDALIGTNDLIDRDYFRHLHRWYLRIATAQSLGAVVFTVWTLQNWRDGDRSAATVTRPG